MERRTRERIDINHEKSSPMPKVYGPKKKERKRRRGSSERVRAPDSIYSRRINGAEKSPFDRKEESVSNKSCGKYTGGSLGSPAVFHARARATLRSPECQVVISLSSVSLPAAAL